MLIELDNCLLGYRAARPVVRVGGRVRVAGGCCLGIYGPNGSGKTTLVRAILGLLEPLAGEVRVHRSARRAYLPQHRQLDLHWPMTALDAASLAVSSRKPFGWVRGARLQVRVAMEMLQVGALADEPFAKLSGGQQQRVLLVGAVADQPQLLVLDEPTDDLDATSRAVLLEQITRLAREGAAAVMVSHEEKDLYQVCDRVLVLWPSQAPGEPSEAILVPKANLSLALGRAFSWEGEP